MSEVSLTTHVDYVNIEANEAKVSLKLNGYTIMSIKEIVFGYGDVESLEKDMVSILAKNLYLLLNGETNVTT